MKVRRPCIKQKFLKELLSEQTINQNWKLLTANRIYTIKDAPRSGNKKSRIVTRYLQQVQVISFALQVYGDSKHKFVPMGWEIYHSAQTTPSLPLPDLGHD